MNEDDQRRRQREALELLTVRVLRDPETFESLMTDVLDDLTPDEVTAVLLDRLVGMTEIATQLVVQCAHLGPDITRDPADFLRVLALYLATDGD